MGKRVGVFAIAGLVACVAGTGCASKKEFRANVEDTDRRITAVEDAVETTGRRIDDLGKTTDQKITTLDGKTSQALQTGNNAMTKAEKAEVAARGKLLWETTISDDGVKFDFGKTALSASSISKLDDLVSKVKSYGKALYIEIEGHTDAVGEEKVNAELGQERAATVLGYLNGKGIPLHAMNTISYGESRPVADNESKDGRAQNRRVVIRVLE